MIRSLFTTAAVVLGVTATPLYGQQFKTTVTAWSITTAYNTFAGSWSDGEENTPSVTAFGAQQKTAASSIQQNATLLQQSSGAAYVSAGAGMVKASSVGSALVELYPESSFDGIASANSNIRAGAQVEDFGTFFLTGLTAGTKINLTAYVGVSGVLSAASQVAGGLAGSQAIMGWTAAIGSNTTNNPSTLTASGGAPPTGTAFATGVFYLSAQVTIGASTSIRYGVSTAVNTGASLRCVSGCAEGQNDSAGNADFGNTFLWGGISRAQLEDGTELDLAQLTMQSASGFNYIRPGTEMPGVPPSTTVPEPGSLLLVATALIALALGLKLGFRARG